MVSIQENICIKKIDTEWIDTFDAGEMTYDFIGYLYPIQLQIKWLFLDQKFKSHSKHIRFVYGVKIGM